MNSRSYVKSSRRGRLPGPTGGRIAAVVRGGAAAAAGLKAGDVLLSLSGHILSDILDYQFYLDPGRQELEVEREGRRLTLCLYVKESIEPGIVFSSSLFDGVRTCGNHCLFCFVDQLPRGLRHSLYLKDDDFRLSFLYGNFITLNNMSKEDLERIKTQRLSPLHVSVHATDTGVRALLMGCSRRRAAAGLDCLRELAEAGIRLHAQVVLCPGINDGAVLERTVVELAAAYPGVASVGIVPVAMADNCRQLPPATIIPVNEEDCIKVVEQVSAWQERFRQEKGCGFVYAADEFFLKGGLPLPGVDYYDDFPQYENGIGIAASFLKEIESMVAQRPAGDWSPGRVFFLTGTLAAPVIKDACALLEASAAAAKGGLLATPQGPEGIMTRNKRFYPLIAKNGLFGPHVTVTGLLGGRDIISAAGAAGLGPADLLLIPSSCLESSGRRFLDDLTIEEMEDQLECKVEVK